MGTLKPQSNGPVYRIWWLVHWPLMGGLLHLVQRGGDWAGPHPAQSPPRCPKCTNFILFDVALYNCLWVVKGWYNRQWSIIVSTKWTSILCCWFQAWVGWDGFSSKGIDVNLMDHCLSAHLQCTIPPHASRWSSGQDGHVVSSTFWWSLKNSEWLTCTRKLVWSVKDSWLPRARTFHSGTGWRKGYIKKTLCYSIVHCHNGVQWHE